MKLGFLTEYKPERAQAARAMGFNCLELRVPSLQSELQQGLSNAEAARRIRATMEENGLSVAALAYYINHFEPGQEEGHAAVMRELIEIAPQLGCDVVATLSGVTPETQQSGNAEATLPAFTATFAEHARVAEGSGVKIALENWPGAHPYGLSRNIAFSPHLWERLFDAVPSPALGLEYDPSHLVRLQIPHVAAIKRFSDRIHHVHAKDTTIRREVLEEVGTTGQGWWRYSIPGRGEVDWNGVFAALREIGYDGPVCIEHEDADFKAEKFDDGLRLGHEFLSRLMA